MCRLAGLLNHLYCAHIAAAEGRPLSSAPARKSSQQKQVLEARVGRLVSGHSHIGQLLAMEIFYTLAGVRLELILTRRLLRSSNRRQ